MVMALPGNAAAINFGTAWGTPNGLDLSMPSYMATGNQVVGEAIARRWTTTAGQLIDDPNYGENIFDLVSAGLSKREIAYAQQRFAAEAEKDERVLSCAVILTFDAAGNVTLTATVVTAFGPFKLVLSVDAVTLALLLVQA
jgi:hypothetical protein